MTIRSKIEPIVRWLATKAGLKLVKDTPGGDCLTDDPVANLEVADDRTSPERIEAEKKFEHWVNIDPFPKIAPSLLNAADIDDYMRTTAMVFPYRSIERKTASYPLRVGHEIAFWDPDAPDQPPIHKLADGATVTIPSNSLVYIRTWELFQLPNYMAVRFNLHINLVHKGLLLGTGPLVDPGFVGQLMVPLHNLTSNTYVLQVGEDFIWAEFTKTSLIDSWIKDVKCRPERSGQPVEFEDRKQKRSLADYVASAQRGNKYLQPGLSYRTLQNAIPEKLKQTYEIAQTAKRSAASAKRWLVAVQATLASFGVIAVVAAAYALVSVIQATLASQQTTQTVVTTTNDRVRDQEYRLKELERQVQQLQVGSKRPADGRQDGGT